MRFVLKSGNSFNLVFKIRNWLPTVGYAVASETRIECQPINETIRSKFKQDVILRSITTK